MSSKKLIKKNRCIWIFTCLFQITLIVMRGRTAMQLLVATVFFVQEEVTVTIEIAVSVPSAQKDKAQ